MKSRNLIFALALVVFCNISLTSCRQCFVCNSMESCKIPQLYDCNEKLASEALVYLGRNHTEVDATAVSAKYACFKKYIYTSTAWSYYMGCIYSNVHVCKLPLVLNNSSSLKAVDCRQCDDNDGCNPASRIRIDLVSTFITIAVAFILRFKF